ncbi:glycoside hydrolase family 25 protein [Cyclobacterium salsum]|uniref:glycoside hydrolase family 25 protein n=1 Tax=Cyclobacterium salsum TaxID=2666329 RepID=UPI001391931B|nr:GH25 family lysozyme [Cyclobacterium salsum]
MYRRILFVLLIGFFLMFSMLLVVILNLTGLLDFGKTIHEHHIYLSETDPNAGETPFEQIDNRLPAGPLYYAGHSAPKESGEIHHRAHHYDSMLRIFDLYQKDWSPGHQTHGYYGIDVSHWQNVIDWEMVKNDSLPHPVSFVLIKATQGAREIDPFFNTNWSSAEKEGILKGAYHFYQYKDPPLEQAAHYISQVNLSPEDILPIVDVELDCTACSRPEISDNLLIQNLKTYLEAIESHYKVKPIIYTYEAFYQTHLKGHFDNYPYWLARFSSKPPTEFKVEPDSVSLPEITMWQFTDAGKIKGIPGKTDMSFLPAAYRAHVLVLK